MIKSKLIFLCLAICFVATSALATDIPMDIAVLRGLDKVTGRISTFSIPVGETGTFGKTFIAVDSCYTRPPEESPENATFLFVYEKTLKGENIELFKGWMFSSNPALSSMEHPVYDIWLIECKKASPKSTNKQEKSVVKPIQKQTPKEQPAPNAVESTEKKNLTPSNVSVDDL